MTEILISQTTQNIIYKYLADPVHALIIEGKQGAGKTSIANYLAAKLLNIDEEKLNKYSGILSIEPKTGSISIDDIRQAQQFLKLKTTGRNTIRRIIIIESAELMTIEAQNAFLKILEEPPADTIIFTLTNQRIKLLPTIRSRSQTLIIRPLSHKSLLDFFLDKGYDSKDIDKAFYAANGQIGLMSALLSQEQNDQLQTIERAKKILAVTQFERLIQIDELLKQKDEIKSFIDSLIVISQAGLRKKTEKEEYKQAERWHKNLKLTLEAQSNLRHNPNLKLLLTDLLLNL